MESPDQDHAFREAFLRCAAGDESALAVLEALASGGATTAAFTDNELGTENVAMAVQDFLREPSQAKRALFLRAAEIVMQRGTAFLTNRAYVGNGGLPAVFFTLNLLAGTTWYSTDPDVVPTHALALLELMVDHGLSIGDHFWSYFVTGLRPMIDHEAERRALRLRVIALAEQHGAFLFNSTTFEDLHHELQGNPIAILLRVGDLETMHALTDALARVEWSAGFTGIDAASDSLLNPFMSSKQNRRVLLGLAKRYPTVTAWLTRPTVLFALIRKKEKFTLRWLINRAPQAVLAARDDQGNGVLHALAAVRGKTEGIAELLVEGGAGLQLVNAEGQTPAMRARSKRNLALAAAFDDLT